MKGTFEREIAKILEMHIKKTHIDKIDTWMESGNYWASLNYQNSSLWIERLDNILDNENPDLHIYFTLLAGVLIDLNQDLESKLSLFKNFPLPNKSTTQKIETLVVKNMRMREHLLKVDKCRLSVKEIISTFSSDETSAVIYFRNKYSHPVLNDYKVRIIKEENGPAFEFDIKKYLRFLRNNQINEIEIFTSTKEKLLGKRESLKELIELFNELRF